MDSTLEWRGCCTRYGAVSQRGVSSCPYLEDEVTPQNGGNSGFELIALNLFNEAGMDRLLL